MDRKESLELTVNDKTYRIGRPGWMVRIKAEEHIRDKRRVDFDAALKSLTGLPLGEVRAACVGAFNTLRESAIVDTNTVDVFLLSHSGTLFLFREALAVHHPGIAQEESDRVFDRMDAEQYRTMDTFLQRVMFPELTRLADAANKTADATDKQQAPLQQEELTPDGAEIS